MKGDVFVIGGKLYFLFVISDFYKCMWWTLATHAGMVGANSETESREGGGRKSMRELRGESKRVKKRENVRKEGAEGVGKEGDWL